MNRTKTRKPATARIKLTIVRSNGHRTDVTQNNATAEDIGAAEQLADKLQPMPHRKT